MAICPHPEIITDGVSGNKELNELYLAWHQGYEAHKLEVITKVRFLEMHISDLAGEIRKLKELRRDLEKQKAKAEGQISRETRE